MLLNNKRFVVAAIFCISVWAVYVYYFYIYIYIYFYFELLTSLSVKFDAFVGYVYPRHLQ